MTFLVNHIEKYMRCHRAVVSYSTGVDVKTYRRNKLLKKNTGDRVNTST